MHAAITITVIKGPMSKNKKIHFLIIMHDNNNVTRDVYCTQLHRSTTKSQ